MSVNSEIRKSAHNNESVGHEELLIAKNAESSIKPTAQEKRSNLAALNPSPVIAKSKGNGKPRKSAGQHKTEKRSVTNKTSKFKKKDSDAATSISNNSTNELNKQPSSGMKTRH